MISSITRMLITSQRRQPGRKGLRLGLWWNLRRFFLVGVLLYFAATSNLFSTQEVFFNGIEM